MDEFKSVFTSIADYVRRMSASQALMLLGISAGFIAGIFVLVTYVNGANYSLLYSGLEPSAANEIVTYLDGNKIPYQIENGGGSILVPDNQVHKSRMALAAQGLPAGGAVGYSIFDETNFGMTEFLQKVNYKRALEGELTRTIMEIHEIKAARVHIVIPKERLFAKDKKETTASILLKLSGGDLSRRQLAGIKHLVASSVEGLRPANISIIDYEGDLLSSDNERDELAGLSSSQLGVRKEVESYLEEKAQSMLDDVIGMNKAVVRISAELDFTQVERTNESYDANGAVVRSEERTENSSNSSDKQPESAVESEEDNKAEATITNYEIPRTVERIVNSVGIVKRLSVAVMLDGVVEQVDDGEGNLTSSYSPRSQEEIDRLTSVVKSAVGFDGDRNDQVEVYNIAFDHEDLQQEQDALDGVYDNYVYVGLLTRIGWWVLIAAILLYFRKKAKVLFASLKAIVPPPPPPVQETPQAQAIQDEMPMVEPERRRPKLLDQMQETAKERPEELAKVIKTMMVSGVE